MIIELSEYQASILNSSIEQTIVTMQEDKEKINFNVCSSLAIETGVQEYVKLKEHLISSWKKNL
jgi:hypothetical protein